MQISTLKTGRLYREGSNKNHTKLCLLFSFNQPQEHLAVVQLSVLFIQFVHKLIMPYIHFKLNNLGQKTV